MTHWHDRQPIFRQLADQITQQILQGIWQEGEALPSVRSVSADMKINHLTVMKGYQLLVDEGLVEKKRGQGMFVAQGAKNSCLLMKKPVSLNNKFRRSPTHYNVWICLLTNLSNKSKHILKVTNERISQCKTRLQAISSAG